MSFCSRCRTVLKGAAVGLCLGCLLASGEAHEPPESAGRIMPTIAVDVAVTTTSANTSSMVFNITPRPK